MIGRPLTKKLLELGARVVVATLDEINEDEKNNDIKYLISDLKYLSNCEKVCKDINIVFQLTGTTGSPEMTTKRPGTFFIENLLPNINMLEAAKNEGVSHYLYTSTYGVYGNSSVMIEGDMWKSNPSDADKYAGWAKRMGELQIEAYAKEYNWKNLHIVRPANVYGPHANFSTYNSMVVASLIRRVFSGENPLNVWGDGSAIRDFIYCDDVAEGMIKTIELNVNGPVNLGSGKGSTIKELLKTIIDNVDETPEIIWDTSKPTGDAIRILDNTKADSYGIVPSITLTEGIKKTIQWYIKNKNNLDKKYNAFTNKGKRE